MELLINVINQKLKLASNLKSLVAGTQKFIKFTFNLPDDWNGLHPFAQFIQGTNSYNDYLDENNSVYLPSEIEKGVYKILLYGSDGTIIATTNYLEITIDENFLVSDASSTNISQSLYDQLMEKFNRITKPRTKVDNAFEVTLMKADTAMQKNVYDTLNRCVDVYDFATSKSDAVQKNVNTLQNEITTAHTIVDTQTNTSVVVNSLQEAISRVITISKNYTNAKVIDSYTRSEINTLLNNLQNNISPKWTNI